MGTPFFYYGNSTHYLLTLVVLVCQKTSERIYTEYLDVKLLISTVQLHSDNNSSLFSYHFRIFTAHCVSLLVTELNKLSLPTTENRYLYNSKKQMARWKSPPRHFAYLSAILINWYVATSAHSKSPFYEASRHSSGTYGRHICKCLLEPNGSSI